MNFCNVCENMYYMRINEDSKEQLQFYCRRCGNVDEILNKNSLCLSEYSEDNNNDSINIRDIFSQGDDYQFLFTSDLANRNKIKKLSKRLNIKITKIGKINKNKTICFKYKNEIFDASSIKKGYTHNF